MVIQEPLGSSDHNQLHFNINIKSDQTKVKQRRRDFRKGNYKEIRKHLAHIDWNYKMENKTATECWNILRGEIDSAIDSFFPMKKQGKRSKKKHLSKEAFRKIRHQQNMWRVYKHTGTDQDYVVYKEALNAATNEVRKSKRNVELKLAQHIKSDSNINAINEVSKGDCIIMGDFNHGNIKWDTLQSTGVEDSTFFVPGTGQFPNSTCISTNQSSEGIIYSAVLTERIRRQRRNTRTIGQQRS